MTKEKLDDSLRFALKTWRSMNSYLRDADEETCIKLLEIETSGNGRLRFRKRIHSRLNRVRADRERKEMQNA